MKKKCNRKIILLLTAAVLLAAVCAGVVFSRRTAPVGEGENLLANGDFEQGMNGWTTGAYVVTDGYTDYDTPAGEGVDGSRAAYIHNAYANDARFSQEVAVSPNTLYRLHGYVRAGAQDGRGANLSVEGVYVFSQSVYDSPDQWQEVTLYGRTGASQKWLTVFVRLGGYSGESTGEAWFDDVTLCRVDSVPEGYAVQSLSAAETVAEQTADTTAAQPGTLWLAGGAAAYLALLWAVARGLRRDRTQPELKKKTENDRGAYAALGALCVFALGIRLLLAGTVYGYDVDVNDFTIWARKMAETGPAGFYAASGFCDYPPGYLLVLWGIGALGGLLGGVSTVLVKTPAILCDVAAAALIWRESRREGAGSRTAFWLAAAYALNPLTLLTGAAWGQVDSVMTLLLLIVVIEAVRGNWKAALPVYMLAVLVKPQALMFGPLGLAALVMSVVRACQTGEQRALWKNAGAGLGLMLAVAAAVVVPFSLQQGGVGWLFELYGRTMGHYDYATVNSCNLYFLMGLNWVGVDTAASAATISLAGVVMTLPVVLAAFVQKGRTRLDKTVACVFAGVTALTLAVLALAAQSTLGHVGTVMIVLGVTLTLLLYLRGGDKKHLPLLGAALLTVLFTLGTMMHERYLFPAVLLLLYAYLKEKDKRVLWLLALVTVTCLLNVGCVLDRNMRIGGASGHLSAPACGIVSDMSVLEYLSAVLCVVTCMAGVYISADLCRPDAAARAFAPLDAQPEGAPGKEAPYTLPESPDARRMTRKDYAWMLAVTAVYAVAAFANLGSMKAPQQGYVFAKADEQATEATDAIAFTEQVVLDLGEEKENFRLAFFGGIHWSGVSFQVEVSPDGESWTGGYSAELSDSGDCFKWKYLTGSYLAGDTVKYTSDPVLLTGRYVRLTTHDVGLTLYEVIARDGEGNALPMTVAKGAAGAEHLVDEPDTLEGEPGWFNSTYFDEIYHARTAYEHLHGLRVYEWTHPPLGKVLMSVGIALFGMTPFGWRFMGALMGVIMLPGMYLVGRQLFRRRWGAIGAMGLMALDFMHYTQTRIATIDSYVVCFIIWTLYFMLRYMRLDYWRTPFWKTFVPLGLSGLFMGLAVASKWTGCYAGVGLAVLFFWTVGRHVRDILRLRKKDARQRTPLEESVVRDGWKRILWNVASCLVFFVAVPLVIYYCSYIPFYAATGGVSVRKIIATTVGDYFKTGVMGGMMGYHSTPGLGMDHFFYSPWYEWPLSIKPMWYASTSYAPEGTSRTIMAFGNPAVWWLGALCLVIIACLWARAHIGRDGRVLAHPADGEHRSAFLLICFLAQYLPWMLVPRGTYIYHYFPEVPVIIWCAVYVWDKVADRSEKWGRALMAGQLALAGALFIAFFPYISGITASKAWLDAMKWFPGWLYY